MWNIDDKKSREKKLEKKGHRRREYAHMPVNRKKREREKNKRHYKIQLYRKEKKYWEKNVN